MEFDENILKLLGSFLTPEDITDLKRTGIKVAVIWGLIEWRTRKRFKTLEDIVAEVKQGFIGIRASFAGMEDAFSAMKESMRALVATVTRVEESDTSSTHLLTERLERHGLRQVSLENNLSNLAQRLTIIETKASLSSPPQQ